MAMNGRQRQETNARNWASRVVAVVLGACVSLSAAPGLAAATVEPETASATQGTVATPEESESTDDALSFLQPGMRIRVAATNADVTEGRFVAVRGGRLVLDRVGIGAQLPNDVPVGSVRSVWVRGRATGSGALVGAALGGVTVAVLGMVIAHDPDSGGSVPKAAVGGLLLGGLLGSLPGSIVGAACPRWRLAYAAGEADERVTTRLSFIPMGPAPPKTEWIGSASLYVGHNRALDSVAPGGAAGWLVSLTSRRRVVSPSLELGSYRLGSRETPTARVGRVRYNESLFHFGPAVSVGPSRGLVRPYLIASTGFYNWTAFNPGVLDLRTGDTHPTTGRGCLGGSIGGGVRVHVIGALVLGLESRWHTNLSGGTDSNGRRLSVLTLHAGATLNW
jgi:hypothetical protein